MDHRALAAEKNNLMRTTFRRNSLSEHGREVIECRHMLPIFGRMGQSVNEEKLERFLNKIDPNHLGVLDYEGFVEVCKKFVKDPAAVAKFKGDDFAFKHLVHVDDFENS